MKNKSLTEFLQSAHEKGLDLPNLIKITEKDERFNPSFEVPDVEETSAVMAQLTDDEVKSFAKHLNGENLPGKIGRKEL